MKKLFAALLFAAITLNLSAQEMKINRLEMGVNFGQVASFSDYARLCFGGNVLYNGIYVDFLHAYPEHRFDHQVTDTQWNDTSAFCINAGYQFPILSWLRLMPLVGYCQTNEGVTDGSSVNISTDGDNTTWYHTYRVTPGTRVHKFNYGGGVSIQPLKWFSINLIATRNAIYGGIGLDVLSFANQK